MDAGVPLFIAEVASKSTWGNDLGLKKGVYEPARVSEYITFDPSGHLIAPALHAWRLEDGVYAPWVADDDGWWYSRALAITFRPAQPFLAIRDRDQRPLSLPRRAFEREDRVEQADIEAQLRHPPGQGA